MGRTRWLTGWVVVACSVWTLSAAAQPNDDNPYGAPPEPAKPAAKAPAPQPPPATRAATPAEPRPATQPFEHVPTSEAPDLEEPAAIPHAQQHEVLDNELEPAPGRPPHEPPPRPEVNREFELEHASKPHAPPGAPAHGASPHAAGGQKRGGHTEAASHGTHHGPGDINWYYGFLGKDADAEPSVLWRKPDMPPPFLANVINFVLFAYILVRYGRKPIREALVGRKQSIMREIDTATKMKEEAEKRLLAYEDKLRHIDAEMERIRKDFREQGEREKQRILEEARERKTRMLQDAEFLIAQEVKHVRATLLRETVEAAMTAAEQMLQQKVTPTDADRLADQYLKELGSNRGLRISKGGSA